jgi:hypothetical protein
VVDVHEELVRLHDDKQFKFLTTKIETRKIFLITSSVSPFLTAPQLTND